MLPLKGSHYGFFTERVFESGEYQLCFHRKVHVMKEPIWIHFDFIVKTFGKKQIH
jgi:hypothetical protein